MSSLSSKLAEREATGKPIRVGLIGAGKFGSTFIAQASRTAGLHLAGIADLSIDRAISSLKRVNFPPSKFSDQVSAQISIEQALSTGKTAIVADAAVLIATPGIDVVIEATGSPAAGIKHALLACKHKTHIIMVNVEADVLAGPLLARKAKEANIIYSMAYGDQPAMISELVDWARASGFKVICAGKGAKYLPEYSTSTPATVWDYYGFSKEQLASDDFNAQMYNSFLDGTKSSLEMALVCNGNGLSPPLEGLKFPPAGIHDMSNLLRPKEVGGQSVMEGDVGTVEVVSSLEKDGRVVFNDIRYGMYVIIEAADDYQKGCFAQYGLKTDSTGRYAINYKPYHFVGLELGYTVSSIMCRGEPTGQTKGFRGDVVATAKRDLKVGEVLDGEGGYMVFGSLTTAEESLRREALPVGLAHGITLKRDIGKGQVVSWRDVEYSIDSQVVKIRREMEDLFRNELGIGA